MSLRDELERGPRFELFEDHMGCVACQETTETWTEVDRETGLCVECWRAWRFSPACADWVDGQEAAKRHAERKP